VEVFVLRLKLERTWCGEKCTIGTLYVNGKTECFTLEDVRREVKGRPVEEWKVPGATAIPAGVYNVVVTPSNRFKRDLPLLENVPGFQGIRIHPGNTSEDTEGCLLVGMAKGPDFVSESRRAFEQLFTKIKESLGCGEKVTIEVA
jgi:hypothetical protein